MIAAVKVMATYWYISVPAILLVAYLGLRWHQHVQAKAEAALSAWLAGPPPALVVPTRFTESWFAENVPYLHPGQVPALYEALRQRGWREDKIDARVGPYVAANTFIAQERASAGRG